MTVPGSGAVALIATRPDAKLMKSDDGILAAIVARVMASEPLECTQAKRAAFDAALERQLISNPAHVFLENPTEH